MDAAQIEKLKALAPAKRVEACIADVMARFPGESKAAEARYFEEVHQHLAPLARQLERQCDELRAENERLRAGLAAGAARQAGSASQVGCERDDGLLNIHAESKTCEVCAASAAGTDKDAEKPQS